jgi:FlaA1/EpsC-like NDP-sugar epimerase
MNECAEKRIVIVGAGEAGRMVAAEIAAHPELDWRAVGFLDDAQGLAGGTVAGIPVLGRTEELEAVVMRENAAEVIIAIPTAPGAFVGGMIKLCRRAGVPFKIVPGVMEIITGGVRIDQIREVRVEDLLGRETIDLDPGSARAIIAGKPVLVTGAGGSIGGELCRQIARVGPGSLVLLGRGENRIFEIEDELRASHPRLDIRTCISDLRDRERTRRIVREHAPEIVFHAAAHKHVHYMERDPEEAVTNNVEASVHLVRAAEESGASRFVFISTDKAADPRGVMGATKRIFEEYLRARSARSPARLITVRFGNVIGSTGSVVPLFLKQIRRGGPVTVSDPRATRYFMTVREAALLVIRAAAIGAGGEIFILDMGEALNMLEVAQDLIMLAGYEPETEIPVVVTGLRDGEKLHESLAGTGERLRPAGEEKLFVAEQARPVAAGIEEGVEKLIALARGGERARVLELMASLAPGFGGGGGAGDDASAGADC